MKNQFGQEIEVGDFVAYVNKTGSYTERKLGVVTGFGERHGYSYATPESTAHVTWVWDGSYGPASENRHKGTVGVKRIVKVDPNTLYPYVRDGLREAAK